MAKGDLARNEKIGRLSGETPQRGPEIEEVDTEVCRI